MTDRSALRLKASAPFALSSVRRRSASLSLSLSLCDERRWGGRQRRCGRENEAGRCGGKKKGSKGHAASCHPLPLSPVFFLSFSLSLCVRLFCCLLFCRLLICCPLFGCLLFTLTSLFSSALSLWFASALSCSLAALLDSPPASLAGGSREASCRAKGWRCGQRAVGAGPEARCLHSFTLCLVCFLSSLSASASVSISVSVSVSLPLPLSLSVRSAAHPPRAVEGSR